VSSGNAARAFPPVNVTKITAKNMYLTNELMRENRGINKTARNDLTYVCMM